MNPSSNPSKDTDTPTLYPEDMLRNERCQELFPSVIRDINEKYRFKVYPHCVEFITKKDKFSKYEGCHKKRSTIKNFTKSSRFRLFRVLAKMKENHDIEPLFVTLTYHFGHEKKENDTKSQLHHFLVQLRNYDPAVEYIWRFEFQERGAPHYHLIVIPGSPPENTTENIYGINIARIWHSIADPNSRAHEQYGCRVVTITSYLKACAYLSKYIAKVDEKHFGIEVGKHWGCSRNLPFELKSEHHDYNQSANIIIEKLRKWLIDHGKSQYADSQYFNIHRNQTIFIDSDEFYMMYRGYIDEQKHIDLLAEEFESRSDSIENIPF